MAGPKETCERISALLFLGVLKLIAQNLIGKNLIVENLISAEKIPNSLLGESLKLGNNCNKCFSGIASALKHYILTGLWLR